MDSFEELASFRQLLQDLCRSHYKSVLAFRYGTKPNFKKFFTDEPDPEKTGLRHVTNTATCIESLLSCPPEFIPNLAENEANGEQETVGDLADAYVAGALERSNWVSEKSATVYARCRGLPLFIRRMPKDSQPHINAINGHLGNIFFQLKDSPSRVAIGEANPSERPEDWYPPNAFHSYWVLEILHLLRQRNLLSLPALQDIGGCESLEATLQRWADHQLSTQIALHVADSPVLDSDQLGWCLAIRTRPEWQPRATDQQLIQKGLACLFQRQDKVGTWRRHRPLFHYGFAGDAYCYPHETLAVLIENGIQSKKAFLRETLQSFGENLKRLIDHVQISRETLVDASTFGWSSGHHATNPNPEGWATASTFTMLQCPRRLVGVWARDQALRDVRRPGRQPSLEKPPLATIGERGNNWRKPEECSVANELVTLFVNPILYSGHDGSILNDPDQKLFDKHQARSAILFGPPGTSKTTLAGSIASALDWHYVEIHANDFLVNGVDGIYRAADAIFARLMNLDHCVVLFDEIDGLVRRREGRVESFERFLTTSMLPKLAELWKQRRIIYFIATNHQEDFDAAIVRAERFDVLLLMLPPDFDTKYRELRRLLGDVKLAEGITREWIETGLEQLANFKEEDADKPLEDQAVRAKFVLLRYDQLRELASKLKSKIASQKSPEVTREIFESALKDIADPALAKVGAYSRLWVGRKSARRDYNITPCWLISNVSGCADVDLHGAGCVKSADGRWWLLSADIRGEPVTVGRLVMSLSREPGRLEPQVSS